MVMSFFPGMHFPDPVKKFEPELPAKFSIVGQVVRTHVARVGEKCERTRPQTADDFGDHVESFKTAIEMMKSFPYWNQ